MNPTSDPTNDPSVDRTADPTNDPSADPPVDPTNDPSTDPTAAPSVAPSYSPSAHPTNGPSKSPTNAPIASQAGFSDILDSESHGSILFVLILISMVVVIACMVFGFCMYARMKKMNHKMVNMERTMTEIVETNV